MKTRALATKLPSDVADALDAVCKQTGLRKNFILAAALREKIEDLQDAYDLRELKPPYEVLPTVGALA